MPDLTHLPLRWANIRSCKFARILASIEARGVAVRLLLDFSAPLSVRSEVEGADGPISRSGVFGRSSPLWMRVMVPSDSLHLLRITKLPCERGGILPCKESQREGAVMIERGT